MPAFDKDIWVFAYGSLMWRPDFEFAEARAALLKGYHRALCIYSHVYRGTPECPGLVLGLDYGGACRGVAYRIAAAHAEDILAAIDAREIIYHVYKRREVMLTLVDGAEPGGRVAAFAYVADRAGPQYAGGLTNAEKVALILQGHGQTGSSVEYLANTVTHLDELGVPDRRLHGLLEDVRRQAQGR